MARHLCPWLVGRLAAHLDPRERMDRFLDEVFGLRLTPAQRSLMAMGPESFVVSPGHRHGRRAAMASLASLGIAHRVFCGVHEGVPYGYQ